VERCAAAGAGLLPFASQRQLHDAVTYRTSIFCRIIAVRRSVSGLRSAGPSDSGQSVSGVPFRWLLIKGRGQVQRPRPARRSVPATSRGQSEKSAPAGPSQAVHAADAGGRFLTSESRIV